MIHLRMVRLTSLPLEAFAAENGAALRRTERDRGQLPASRARRLGLHLQILKVLPGGERHAQHSYPFRLARLAALRFIVKVLGGEEKLLPSRENKLGFTVQALQNLVLEFHILQTGLTTPEKTLRTKTEPRLSAELVELSGIVVAKWLAVNPSPSILSLSC
jgi:hypothetical protein